MYLVFITYLKLSPKKLSSNVAKFILKENQKQDPNILLIYSAQAQIQSFFPNCSVLEGFSFRWAIGPDYIQIIRLHVNTVSGEYQGGSGSWCFPGCGGERRVSICWVGMKLQSVSYEGEDKPQSRDSCCTLPDYNPKQHGQDLCFGYNNYH